jgi:Parvulin-like peptidyl-prolyl isomerase
MNYWNILSFLSFCLLSTFSFNAYSQKVSLDKITAIVSDKIILRSEVENAFEETKRESPDIEPNYKCEILQQFISQKILLEQAARDSIIVTDEEVEGQLDNRIRYFISQFGSEQKVEEMAGKSIYQMKDEYRPLFRDKLLSDRMQQSVIANVKITPQEVKAFYDKIPVDSLPFFPSMVEVGQIVFKPNVNKEVEKDAYEKLENIRKEIISGKAAFDVMAGIYSEDPVSRDNGGDLGIIARNELVPEFASAAFRLQNGEISNIVKTKYGYHLIQMMNRQGEKAKIRHILVKPIITSDMVKDAKQLADSVRAQLIAGKMSFSEAVGRYTSDDATKMAGGMFTDPQTGSALITPDELDPEVVITIGDMQKGEYSQPQEFIDRQSGDKLVRIIYLKNRTEPHRANLKDDYSRIQQIAFMNKQNDYLFKWLEEKVPTFYIYVDEEFHTCPNITQLLNKRNTN